MLPLRSMKIEFKAEAKSKYRVIGSGTILMLIGLLVFVGSKFFVPSKVMIERQIKTSGESHFERKPSVSNILSWSTELKLTANQQKSLRKLLEKEQQQMAPVIDEINKVAKDFDRFFESRRATKVSINEIHKQAECVSDLSQQKRQIEQAFAARALVVLDTQQKTKATKLAKSASTKGTDKRLILP